MLPQRSRESPVTLGRFWSTRDWHTFTKSELPGRLGGLEDYDVLIACSKRSVCRLSDAIPDMMSLSKHPPSSPDNPPDSSSRHVTGIAVHIIPPPESNCNICHVATDDAADANGADRLLTRGTIMIMGA
mmetsp:Transcript_18846/g.45288  ORF Transcript_18846/g.45288 Transcript_18846/m.45288 type:complete len:129 (+) Transcript_18846:388-774(+)